MTCKDFIEKYEGFISYPENIEFPDEWGTMLDSGMNSIREYLRAYGLLTNFKILQIKQKFGELRFYHHLDDISSYNIHNAWLTGAVNMMELYVSKVS